MAAPSPCSPTPRRDSYQRRRPDETLLYQLIEEHWPAFRERAEQAGGLPDFIVEEFEAYLRCGMLEHGVAHFACRQCGESLCVAFSCKRRGFCPSCFGRRMSDVAAHLVDEVFPEVPVRQWVCSLPWQLRYAMGYDRALCADVLDAFIVALRRSLRLRAKAQLGLRSVEDALFGAVTFIQRGDSSLRLNVHFHCLVLDGVYVRDDRGELRFHELGAPTHEEITDVARWTHERLGRVLARHGRSLDMLEGDDGAADGLVHEQPVLASCYGASAADQQLLGDAPGQQTCKLAHPVRAVAEPKPNAAVAEVGGVNVHAGAAVPSRDRQRLERLCRYVARPPLAQDRLELTADGRCRYNFRHAWKNGVHAVVLAPLDLIARLCALIPPPRFHMLRYHGVLAAHANARAEVVPGPEPKCAEPTQIPLSFVGEPTALEGLAKQPARHPWAWLLQRVFAVDVMTCPRCRGGMRLVKSANKPDEIARVLADLGLGARPPPRPRPAPKGQLELHFAA